MNAKAELLKKLTGKARMKCASISYGRTYWDDDTMKVINLKVDYTQDEFDAFLKALDFEYDAGYGGQELFGTVWFEDGNWLDRGEYDGSEWWVYQSCPEIPEVLIKQ